MYFVYDPEEGFQTFLTEEAAKEHAEWVLGEERSYASGDGWSELVTQICWGKVMGKVELTKEWESDSPDFDVYQDYELKDME